MHLQVDVGCERSGCKDTGAAIAEAMQLNYLFVCEFQEMHSPLRNARSQGGGVHGNAILSRQVQSAAGRRLHCSQAAGIRTGVRVCVLPAVLVIPNSPELIVAMAMLCWAPSHILAISQSM